MENWKVSDLLYVNFKWSILVNVSSFDSIEKINWDENGSRTKTGNYFGILLKKNGKDVRLIEYARSAGSK